MTNFERIKNMTKEELAKEIELIAGWDRKEFNKAKKIKGFFIEYLEKEIKQINPSNCEIEKGGIINDKK